MTPPNETTRSHTAPEAGAREVPVTQRSRREEVTVLRVIGEPRSERTEPKRSYRFVAVGGRRMPA